MEYNCEAKNQPAQPVLTVRTRTSVNDLSAALGRAFATLGQYLGELGESPAGAPFVAYYNMDMQNLDIEIGFPVNHPLPDRGEIQSSIIPEGMVATVLYIGPYQDCSKAYEQLGEFIQSHGYQPTGVSYEYYLNDPQETPPEQLQTQIVFPLKEA